VEVVIIVDTKKCPGLNTKKKKKRSYTTIYQCEECTVEKKRPFWLCHTTKKIDGKDVVVSVPVVLSVVLFLI
jgi:ribosomal protein L37AE/L43A